ncbi:MAG: hypothetical protein IT370_14485 [Deltaproteobacteria bacterium]|nr:hypothetical protein [Deltaproteobacteria bacterium]
MKRLLLALALSVGAMTLAGCPDSDVGKACVAGAPTATGGSSIINSQALECNSRICFRPSSAAGGGTSEDLCTDFCSSSSDCNDGPKDKCKAGFACAVAVTVGPFCCKKMCICKDYLSISDAGIVRPEACNPDKPENKCPNIR